MKSQIAPLVLALALIASTAAHADVTVSFTESAPKDSFTVTNTGSCDIGPSTVTIDLSTSVGGLIFDTTGSGAGVQVFQPFELVSGANRLVAVTAVSDGNNLIELQLSGLPPGEAVAFTIDVDDTLTNSTMGQTRVAGSEISGAVVSITGMTATKKSAAFTASGKASVVHSGCTS
ncbi:MAG: hypothetical protein RIC36_04330 [Rhodospirillales bacterium]